MEKNNKSILGTLKKAKEHNWSFDDANVNNAIRVTSLILLALLSVFVLIKTMGEVKAFGTIGQAPATPYMITVSGEGEVAGVKDIAMLSFSSYGKGKTATEAQSIAAEANNKAIAFLKSKGINEKDISTESYNTYPTYDQKVKPCIYEDVSADGSLSSEGSAGSARGAEVMGAPTPDIAVSASRPTTIVAPIAPCNNYESVITGYETNQSIQVKIRGIDKNPSLTGEIITGLAGAGVRVASLQNSIDNIDELKSDARAIAISKAHAEAKDIARSLGARLGKVVSYNENGGSYPMYDRNMMSAKAESAPVSPEIPAGEGKVISNVSVTYEIR